MSEDKVRTKNLCSTVGTIYDPKELLGVSTTGLGVDGVLQIQLKNAMKTMAIGEIKLKEEEDDDDDDSVVVIPSSSTLNEEIYQSQQNDEVECWGPSASEGPQKRNLTMSSKKICEQVPSKTDCEYTRTWLRRSLTGTAITTKDKTITKLCAEELRYNGRKRKPT
jgi:hypothetical protein